MTVKSKRGRRRYIAFTVSCNLENRESLISRIAETSGNGRSAHVIQCGSGMAIARCAPDDREPTIDILRQADPSSEPLLTSGTLRTLRDKYPELRAPNGHRRP
jgi:hypothetical protein